MRPPLQCSLAAQRMGWRALPLRMREVRSVARCECTVSGDLEQLQGSLSKAARQRQACRAALAVAMTSSSLMLQHLRCLVRHLRSGLGAASQACMVLGGALPWPTCTLAGSGRTVRACKCPRLQQAVVLLSVSMAHACAMQCMGLHRTAHMPVPSLRSLTFLSSLVHDAGVKAKTY